MSPENDARLISLDFIGEAGEILCSLSAAVVASASTERLDLLELSLRQARATLIEAIREFKKINGARDEY